MSANRLEIQMLLAAHARGDHSEYDWLDCSDCWLPSRPKDLPSDKGKFAATRFVTPKTKSNQ